MAVMIGICLVSGAKREQYQNRRHAHHVAAMFFGSLALSRVQKEYGQIVELISIVISGRVICPEMKKVIRRER